MTEDVTFTTSALQPGNAMEAGESPPMESKDTQQKRPSYFMKNLAVYFNICTFAIIGCLIRIGLEELLGSSMLHAEDSGSIIFGAFFANMAGSLILGLLAGSSLKAMPGMLPVYTGISTGLCGSITTYSKFNQQVSLMIYGEAQTTGNPQYFAFAAILLGIAAPLCSFVFGLDISKEIRNSMKTDKDGGSGRVSRSLRIASSISYINLILFVAGMITLIVLSVVYSDRQRVIFVCLSAAMAPFGAVMRFLLARLNTNPPCSSSSAFLKSFPLGTFLANFIGAVVIALVYVLITWADLACPWLAFFKAIQSGFCACLTTMSTFVSEIHDRRSKNLVLASHAYPFITIVVSEIFACIINGVSFAVYTNNPVGLSNSTCA